MWALFESSFKHTTTLAVIALREVVNVISILDRGVLVDEIVAIFEVFLTALAELAIGYQISVRVILIDWLIVPCPLALIGIPAETVESLALKLRLPQTSFGYACLVSGWRASSRTG